MAIVSDLAVIDLYKYRSVAILSAGDKDGYGQDFTMGQVIAVNQNGDPIEQTQMHPAVAVMDNLERRRERIMDKLNESRKAKMDIAYKLGSNNVESKLLQEIGALKRAIEAVASGEPIEMSSEEEEMVLLDGAI